MAKLSLNKAAIYAGKAKADILKALKSNDHMTKLSGEKSSKGHWEIDTAELDRVFPKKVEEPLKTGNENQKTTPKNTSATSALEVEVKLLREMLDKTEQDRDGWKEQAQKITGLIEDQRTKNEGGFSIFGLRISRAR